MTSSDFNNATYALHQIPASLRKLFPAGSTDDQKFAFQTYDPDVIYSDDRYSGVYLTVWSLIDTETTGNAATELRRNSGSEATKKRCPVCLVEYRYIREMNLTLQAVYVVPKLRKQGVAAMALTKLAYWEIDRQMKTLRIKTQDNALGFLSKVFGDKYRVHVKYDRKTKEHLVTVSSH